MNKKILLATFLLAISTSLSGCSQVHFGRDAVTIGQVPKAQKAKRVVKKKPKKQVKKSTPAKPKKTIAKKTAWEAKKTKKLQQVVNKWSLKSGQQYTFYQGKKALKTKKGPSYPAVFKQKKFILKKKQIGIGYSPLGKNKYQYNVVAIANDNFKSWHNTYLFCLKNKKPVILLDQSKNTNPIMVKTVEDQSLNQGFIKIYKN